jgi:hypothetical protein
MDKTQLFDAYIERCKFEKTIRDKKLREGKYITRIREVDIISTVDRDYNTLDTLLVKCCVIDSVKGSYYEEGEEMYWHIPMKYENYTLIKNFLDSCPPMYKPSSLLTKGLKETAAYNCCLLLAVKETDNETKVKWLIDQSVYRMDEDNDEELTKPF